MHYKYYQTNNRRTSHVQKEVIIVVKHVVLFKLKDVSFREQAVAALIGMKGKIEGMTDLEVGTDFIGSERSYDVALYCTLKDRAALEFYQAHPLHQPVKKIMAELRLSSVACDYEV